MEIVKSFLILTALFAMSQTDANNEERIEQWISGSTNPKIEVNGVSKGLWGHMQKNIDSTFGQIPIFEYKEKENCFENRGPIVTESKKYLPQFIAKKWAYLPGIVLVVGTNDVKVAKKVVEKLKAKL